MIMANRPPDLLPDPLPRIEVWRSHLEMDDFQARIMSQDLPDRVARMPRGTVPEEQNTLSGNVPGGLKAYIISGGKIRTDMPLSQHSG
jgi:hypothetical protein